MSPTLPPYALSAPAFPLRQLASLAGRAPIGGAREVALACFVAARLAAEQLVPEEQRMPEPARLQRAAGAKGWLGTLALPAAVKAPLGKCVEHSAEGARAALAQDVATLVSAAEPWLDAAARGELQALSRSLRE